MSFFLMLHISLKQTNIQVKYSHDVIEVRVVMYRYIRNNGVLIEIVSCKNVFWLRLMHTK